jgi:hypothetical protein
MINAVVAPAKERSRKRRSDIVSARMTGRGVGGGDEEEVDYTSDGARERRNKTTMYAVGSSSTCTSGDLAKLLKSQSQKYRNPCSRAELALWLLPKSVLSRRANQAPGD